MAKFVVAAGHDDRDPGALGNGVREEDIAQEVRNLVHIELVAAGHECHMDGTDAENRPLRESIGLIKTVKPDLAIEIHTNSFTNPAANGVETISLPKYKEMSQKISAAIAKVMGSTLRGDKGWIDQSQSKRGKLGFVEAGGLIIELFFISNPQELKKYYLYRADIAKAIAKVILDEFGEV